MLFSAWISSSQPLQEPASTSRIDSVRPSRARAAWFTCAASSASAASSAAGAASVSGPRAKLLSISLKVMAGIRAVEGFIAEREVGHDVALDRRLEQRPLEPGRIAQVAALDAAVRADAHPREDVAAETLDQCGAFARATSGGERSVGRARGQSGEELVDQRQALLDFTDANPYACVDVAGLHGGDLELECAVRRIAGRAPRIEVAARRA